MPISVKIFESIFNLNSASNSFNKDSSNQFSSNRFLKSVTIWFDEKRASEIPYLSFLTSFVMLNWTVNEILSEQSFKKSRCSRLTSRGFILKCQNIDSKWLGFDIGKGLRTKSSMLKLMINHFCQFIKFQRATKLIFKLTKFEATPSKSRGNCLEADQSTWTVRVW